MKLKNKNNKRLTVIDFFCGGGGFSEGFRRAGFDVIMGVDSWKPAIETHNFNHNLKDKIKFLEAELSKGNIHHNKMKIEGYLTQKELNQDFL